MNFRGRAARGAAQQGQRVAKIDVLARQHGARLCGQGAKSSVSASAENAVADLIRR